MEFKLRNPKIYVISGKSSSGKDTVANLIKNKYQNGIIISYASYLKEYAKQILNWDGKEESKPRDFLQQIGVELIKTKIDPDMLVKRIIEDIKVYSYFYDVIIISDARFKNEIEDIKTNFDDVFVIHVEGDKTKLTKLQQAHATETSLDNYDNYDYIIKNDYNYEHLDEKISKIVGEI